MSITSTPDSAGSGAAQRTSMSLIRSDARSCQGDSTISRPASSVPSKTAWGLRTGPRPAGRWGGDGGPAMAV